ncbi:MAG: pyrimidine 5'-nucleotidase [Desulfuromonadaceae bacterium]|nr:pyrimidine 5'-nucleotidase [Desulfuromonas sp.]MDY0185397.1 pyrimidine 5'-nucleotidase [Desulfuromonadaceae bacterium]
MKAVFFDLDNTLYAAESDLFGLIDVRINSYMRDVVGIETSRVDYLRRHYWDKYGVTLRGLMHEYGTDAEHYLEYVHDIDVSSRLGPNPELKHSLCTLPERCFVFTNGSSDHARRVLSCLDIADCFEHIYDIRISNYVPKPQPDPYRAALAHSGMRGDECIMVEDSLPNLRTAARLNMATILVDSAAQSDVADIDAVVPSARHAAEVIKSWRKKRQRCAQ